VIFYSGKNTHTYEHFGLRYIAKSFEFGCWLKWYIWYQIHHPQAPKIVKSRHFYVIVIQKNANVTSFRKNISQKTLKTRILQFADNNSTTNTTKHTVVPARVDPSQGSKNTTLPSLVFGTSNPIPSGQNDPGRTTCAPALGSVIFDALGSSLAPCQQLCVQNKINSCSFCQRFVTMFALKNYNLYRLTGL
jgi:hypothetical protein